MAYPDYAYYRDHNRVFSGLMSFSGDLDNVVWSHGGLGETIQCQGVAAPRFRGAIVVATPDIWASPATMVRLIPIGKAGSPTTRHSFSLPWARLRPGVSAAQA